MYSGCLVFDRMPNHRTRIASYLLSSSALQALLLCNSPVRTMKSVPELPFRVLTHNIRHSISSPLKGERLWEDRRQLLLNAFKYHTRHQDSFICLQEVHHNQLVDILSGLNKTRGTDASQNQEEWAYIGVGRDDGHETGEYSPIFYRPATWQLRHWETAWLSETPHVPSKSWDADSIRIVTIGVFTHHASHQTVLAMNTHLDDKGSRSRYEAAHIMLDKIREYRSGKYGDTISGVFVAGDFNSEESQEAYTVLTGPRSTLVDSGKAVSSAEHYGNQITWTGFGYEDEPASRIDYILVGPGASRDSSQCWRVEGYAVQANRFDDGVYCSDHRAVVADVALLG